MSLASQSNAGLFTTDTETSKYPLQSQRLLDPVDKPGLHPDPSAEDATVQPRLASYGLLKRLGSWSAFVLIGSLPVLFAAVAFLVFLWKSSSTNNLWVTIVENGWIPRAITLTTIVIRVMIASQSVVCISMLSAVVLESQRSTLLNAPAVSILRFINSGPSSLAHVLWNTLIRGKNLEISVTVMALFLTTTMSQFTSTFLLSDIQSTPFMTKQETTSMPTNFDYSQWDNVKLYTDYDLWTQRPASFPTFAEYSEPGLRTEEQDDTGHIFRALLPFTSSKTRSALSTYSGNATIFDARAVCTRPTMQITNLILPTTAMGDLNPYLYLEGTFRLAQVQNNNSAYDTTFKCFAPLPYGPEQVIRGDQPTSFAQSKEWLVAVCQPDNGIFIGNLDLDGYSLVVMNLTGTYEQWNSAVANIDHWGDMEYAKDEWFTYYDSPSQTGINITVCFTMSMSTYNQQISAQDGINHTEPSLGYDTSHRMYQAEELLTSLGVGSQEVQQLSPPSRGQLALEPPILETFPDFDIFFIEWSPNSSYFMCTYCFYDQFNIGQDPGMPKNLTAIRPTPPMIAVFNSALQITGRSAQAFQALITILKMTTYTAFLPLFDALTPVTYQFYSSGLAPARMMGLTAVLAMIVAHLVLIAICFALFAYRSRMSLVGNAWTAVAQVSEIEEAREWLHRAGRLTDKEIEKQMRFRGVGRKLVGLPPSFEAEKSSSSTAHVAN